MLGEYPCSVRLKYHIVITTKHDFYRRYLIYIKFFIVVIIIHKKLCLLLFFYCYLQGVSPYHKNNTVT